MELGKQIELDSNPTEKQIRQYFNKIVKPVHAHLINYLIKTKPQDILQTCIKWFKDRKGDMNRTDDSSDDGQDLITFQTVDDEVFQTMKEQKLKKARKRRIGFASQKLDRRSVKVQNGEKKQQQTHMRILFFCMNSFLFRNFSEKQIDELIKKMRKVEARSGDQICKQGQFGDKMYFVDQGSFKCIQQTQQGIKILKNYYLGDTFGQICLLHKIRRQATIITQSDGILYSLDRQSYITFKKMCIIKKRALYLCTLTKRPEFSHFSEQEIQKISDVLVQVNYEQGELVINEGDVGTKFYIVLDGILVAFSSKNNNSINLFYKEGDMFGEVAIVKDKPRQASIKALTRCKLVYLTRQVFRRIFEKNPNIQREIDQKYAIRQNMIVNNKRRVDNSEEGKQKPNVRERGGRRSVLFNPSPGINLIHPN